MNRKLKPVILVVDDEPDICELLKISLQRMGAEVLSVNNFADLKKMLQQHLIDCVLTDMNLGNENGLEIVKYLNKNHPAVPCAVITAYGDMTTAVNALKSGAFDFVAKPIEINSLRQLFDNGLKLSKTNDWGKLDSKVLIGESEEIIRLKNLIEKSANSHEPILIWGPPGSGKNLLTKLIYRKIGQATKSLTALNFSVLEPTAHVKKLLEALLQANGGILLLNHIDLLSTQAQYELSELLKTQVIIVDNAPVILDVKFIFTSNSDLLKLVKDNKFNEELYYQISIIILNTPFLANLPEDLPLLINYFLQQLTSSIELSTPTLTTDAIEALRTYSYPGNVRELETILRRALALCKNNIITSADLQLDVIKDSNSRFCSDNNTENSLQQQLEALEKQRILNALAYTKGNKTAAAKELGITFRALRYRLKKFTIR